MSYTRSTGRSRMPFGQNVLSGVDVPVMQGAAVGACPLACPKREVCEQVPALRAEFTARVETVDHNEALAVPTGLVFKECAELTPASVRDGLSQTAALDHVRRCEVFDHDGVELADDLGGQLMMEVSSSVSNLGVDASNFSSGFVSVVRALGLSSHHALVARQFLLLGPQPLGVGDRLPGGQRGEVFKSNVDPDIPTAGLCGFGFVFEQHRNEVATGGVPRHRDRAGRTFGNFTGPRNRQRVFHFGEEQLAVSPTERRRGVLRRRPSPARLEPGIPRAFVEEIVERGLLMPQSLLQRHGRDFRKPRRFGVLLLRRQKRGQVVVAERLLRGAILAGSQRQSPVPDKPNRPEGTRQDCRLFDSRVEPELVRLLHTTSVPCVSARDKEDAPSSPCLKAGVSGANI